MKITNNPRVLLYLAAVFIALILIAPLPSEQGLQSRLKYGLDLEGGSWLQLQLQGAIVQLNVDPAKILEKQFQASSVDKTGDNYLVTVNGQTPANLAENLGYPGAKAVTRNNVTRINIPISGETVVTNYLKSILDADVKIVGVDPVKYEIRTNVTRESLNAALADVGGSVATGPNTFVDGVTPDTVDETKKVLDQKLNRLGMQDIKVRVVGNQFILIDLAGVDVSTAQDIVGKPGKFEIRIQTQNNQSEHVLYGDAIESVDIPRADRGDMAGVPFTLSESGASTLQKAAIDVGATKNPKAHELSMYLDKDQVFSAPLAPELASSIAKAPMRNLVAEVGTGDAGILKAKELYIHLKEGALPVNVKVIGSGQVTAALGSQFKFQIVIAGILALLAVAGMIFWRYRNRRIVFPLVFTSVSEVIMILGIWSLLGWQLDLAGIAGIITVIGTGVDQLVIITDRLISGATSLPGKSEGKYAASGSKLHAQRIMEILGIIIGAAATTVAGMLPLLRMGFGSLTGFALTVIIGVFIGVGIARPAYASIADYILADDSVIEESRPMAGSGPKSGPEESIEEAAPARRVIEKTTNGNDASDKSNGTKKAPKKKGARKGTLDENGKEQ